MDFSSLREQVSNLTLYDIKAGVRKVQNAVMNYTEMEAKVREATNNEPWGASSTLMQEIANGTHNYQLLSEIMPMIYKRFTEKSAEEWRQIYKALQLLEFLIKNGSERVVDDARSHMPLLRMLRQFHYIDPNGKDQGINVRNRSQELVKLLGDVDAIRAERKKARANRNKFGGIQGGIGIGGSLSSSNSRYGGFGSDSAAFGGYSGGVYGDGGGFGGNNTEFRDSGRRGSRFEEYDEDEESTVPSREYGPSSPRSKRESKPSEPPKAPEPDLFDFTDDVPAKPSSTATANLPATAVKDVLRGNAADDDEFDDFQSAAPATQPLSPPPSQFSPISPPAATATATANPSTQFAAPKPVSGTQGPNLNDLVSFSSFSPTPNSNTAASSRSPSAALFPSPIQLQQKHQQVKPIGYQAATPNYFTSISVSPAQASSPTTRPGLPTTSSFSSTTSSSAASKPATTTKSSSSGGDAFGSLWSTASANAGIQKSSTVMNKGPNLASMAKEKSSAGIWGMPATPGPTSTPGFSSSLQQQQQKGQKSTGSSSFEDLLG